MTDALKDLLAKVEAGVSFIPWQEVTRAIGLCPDDRHLLFHHALSGSLDAAKALHDAVLPGWWWTVGTCCVSDDARVAPDFNCPASGKELLNSLPVEIGGAEWPMITDTDLRPSGNPARAWLIAILKALISEKSNDL